MLECILHLEKFFKIHIQKQYSHTNFKHLQKYTMNLFHSFIFLK